MHPLVCGTFLSAAHTFSKQAVAELVLLEGRGVQGDAHCGVTVKHRSRVAKDPMQPNLRQVHLIQEELFGELAAAGFQLAPGDLGENLTTRGIDLLALPRDTLLRVGDTALLRVTGLRNPCVQINRFRPGLMQAVLDRKADGTLQRKAGVMAVVLRGGTVRRDDALAVQLPAPPHRALETV
jgi:MOSC domain-containing protein YiiM